MILGFNEKTGKTQGKKWMSQNIETHGITLLESLYCLQPFLTYRSILRFKRFKKVLN